MSIRVLWEGSFFHHHSLALVNRQLVSRLAGSPDLSLAIRSGEDGASLAWEPELTARLRALEIDRPGPVDVCVRHRWPLDLRAPESGAWVIVQPWEYGSLPRTWYEPMRFGADEVWVPSSFNRQVYVEAGIPGERVRVVPNGVHEALFSAPAPFPLRTRKRFRFLFVGGTILRKGIDALLEAYRRTFTAADDVCLVIKDFGDTSFYRGQTYGARIREMQRDPGMPEIEYLTEELTPERMRDLYHACDCLVHPYRGEGFGLPIAEAMACGLPVIVPDQGGASDFADESTALLLPSRRVAVPQSVAKGLDTRGYPWWLETDRAALAERMRAVYEAPDSFAALAERGRERVRQRFTWQAAAEVAADALRQIGAAERPTPRRDDGTEMARDRLTVGVERWSAGAQGEAIRHFALARNHDASPDALFNLGAALATQADHGSAIRLLGRVANDALHTDPSLAVSALNLVAACHLERQQAQPARVALESALRVDAANEETRALLERLDSTPAAVKREDLPDVLWRAPVFNGSGYADETRNFVLGLRDLGWKVRLDPIDPVADANVVSAEEFRVLREMVEQRGRACEVHIQHVTADIAVAPQAPVSVLRTMFETDRLVPEWAEVCNRFAEVWVPTEFNRETFARSGVVEEKLRVVPESLDTALFDPARHRPLRLETPRGFRFLSIFDWQYRKGWDVLLQSYFEEFAPDEDVALVVKAGRSHTRVPPSQFIQQFARERGFRTVPPVEVVDRYLTTEQMISLYRACNAFVLPSRGEGWGRPYMEAMALGLPTIGTRWSGNLAFMNEQNSYLIDVEGLEPADKQGMAQFEGHLWARPSVASTRRLMRRVFEERGEAMERAARAREEIMTRFGREEIARQLAGEILRLVG